MLPSAGWRCVRSQVAATTTRLQLMLLVRWPYGACWPHAKSTPAACQTMAAAWCSSSRCISCPSCAPLALLAAVSALASPAPSLLQSAGPAAAPRVLGNRGQSWTQQQRGNATVCLQGCRCTHVRTALQLQSLPAGLPLAPLLTACSGPPQPSCSRCWRSGGRYP